MKPKINDVIRVTWSAINSILNPGRPAKPLPKKESPRHPEIYVFRHGESYDNKRRVFSGWRDSKLTPLGKKQARILAQKLTGKQIDVCIVSRLSRSKETAQIALRGHQIKYEVDDRVIERDYGDLAGKSKVKLMEEELVKAVKFRRFYDVPPPNGESLKDVKKRVFPFCRDLVKRIRRTGENVAISCHGNSMKIIRLYFEKLAITDVLVQENPLAKDYAEYIVTPKRVLVARQLQ